MAPRLLAPDPSQLTWDGTGATRLTRRVTTIPQSWAGFDGTRVLGTGYLSPWELRQRHNGERSRADDGANTPEQLDHAELIAYESWQLALDVRSKPWPRNNTTAAAYNELAGSNDYATASWATSRTEDSNGDPVTVGDGPLYSLNVNEEYDQYLMMAGELHLWWAMNRPAEPVRPAAQLDRAALSGDTVPAAFVPFHPELGELTGAGTAADPLPLPVEWVHELPATDDLPVAYALRDFYLTPAELGEVAAPDPDPDDPDDPGEPVADTCPTVADVLAYSGLESELQLDELVAQHLTVVCAQVWAYTRGRGFAKRLVTAPDPGLRAVIVSAASRSASNPTGAESVQLGELRTRPGIYAGWTLPELAILHSYRQRWA